MLKLIAISILILVTGCQNVPKVHPLAPELTFTCKMDSSYWNKFAQKKKLLPNDVPKDGIKTVTLKTKDKNKGTLDVFKCKGVVLCKLHWEYIGSTRSYKHHRQRASLFMFWYETPNPKDLKVRSLLDQRNGIAYAQHKSTLKLPGVEITLDRY